MKNNTLSVLSKSRIAYFNKYGLKLQKCFFNSFEMSALLLQKPTK